MKWIVLLIFLLADIGAMFSVPSQVRKDNWWRVLPGCGFVLAATYHFGNKLSCHEIKDE